MWASLSDDELIKTSELIVIGEWLGHTTIKTRDSESLTVGVISISEVLKGSKTATVALVAQSAPSAPRSSSDVIFQRGSRGLWLLAPRKESQGIYLADHPQRFVPMPSGNARIAELRKKL